MRWPISEPTLRSLERTQGARRGFVQQPSHSDVTRVRRPAGVGQALFDGGSSDVAPDPNPGDATSPTLRHFQELKRAPPRASGSAYACSATKALAGDGPIAVPHTAAKDEMRACTGARSEPAPLAHRGKALATRGQLLARQHRCRREYWERQRDGRMNPAPDRLAQIVRTLAALGPFGPCSTSYSTFAPSASDLKPLPAIAEW